MQALEGFVPLWEQRHASSATPAHEHVGRFAPADSPYSGPMAPPRLLLRPVYWLGSWQFACLDYYRPPRGALGRCVSAEPFPGAIRDLVTRIETVVRSRIDAADIPKDWHLNVCLINYYGARREADGWRDAGRVGEHRDEEPGPVASISLGARALLQFVTRTPRGVPSAVVTTQWLDHGGLQVFAGQRFKRELLHRVTRVDRRIPPEALAVQIPGSPRDTIGLEIPDFRTRRINLTFRYVPDAHVGRACDLPPESRAAVLPYLETLATHSDFWRGELTALKVPETPRRRP